MLLMGDGGLKKATEVAILSDNYIAARLEDHYSVLYRGDDGRVAHECIVDLRPQQDKTGVAVEDVAKRAREYGFAARTATFPVSGQPMIATDEYAPRSGDGKTLAVGEVGLVVEIQGR